MSGVEREASLRSYAEALEDSLRDTTLALARLEAVLREVEAERDALRGQVEAATLTAGLPD